MILVNSKKIVEDNFFNINCPFNVSDAKVFEWVIEIYKVVSSFVSGFEMAHSEKVPLGTSYYYEALKRKVPEAKIEIGNLYTR